MSKYISLRTKPSSICKVKPHLRIGKLNFHDLETQPTLSICPTKYMDFSHGMELASKIFLWINDLIHIPPICYWVQQCNTFDSQSILWTGSPKVPVFWAERGSKVEENEGNLVKMNGKSYFQTFQ